MSTARQFDKQTLRQAVEAMGKEEDVQIVT